jgi:hypothetical protein
MSDWTAETLRELAEGLPQGYRDLGSGYGENSHAEFDLAYNAGANVWELEYCCLDGNKNFAESADTLEQLLACAVDRIKSWGLDSAN